MRISPGLHGVSRSRASTPASWIDPLDLNPYLYFAADTNVNTSGGAVDTWYSQWYGGSAPSNGRGEYLTQSTANLQPAHDSADGHITFDVVSSEEDKLEYSSAVTQAGVLITATSNGIFAFVVNADSVDEITALGFETGYFQGIDLYAMAVLPTTVTDAEIAGVIKYFEREKGATRNPAASPGVTYYWKDRTDIVTPKLDAIDFSALTDLREAWEGCSSMTSFPTIDSSNVTNFYRVWQDCTALTSFPELDVSSGVSFSSCWYNCDGLTSFPALTFSSGTNFYAAWRLCNNVGFTSFPAVTFSTDADDDIDFTNTWRSCTRLTSFPALNLSRGTDVNSTWKDCTAMTSFGACTFSTTATDDISFNTAWSGCTALTTFPALNLSRGTTFVESWMGNTAMTSFGAVTFSTHADDDVNFTDAWRSCTALESFPALNLSRGTNFANAWYGCNDASFTSFPVVTFSTDADDDINFHQAWYLCSAFTSFPHWTCREGGILLRAGGTARP